MLWRQACLVQSLDLLLPSMEAAKGNEAALHPLLLAFCGLIAAAPVALVRMIALTRFPHKHLMGEQHLQSRPAFPGRGGPLYMVPWEC